MNTQIDILINAQREFFQTGQTRDIDYRKTILRTLDSLIRCNEGRILEALHQDLGKSQFEAYLGEIDFTLKEISHAIKNLSSWTRAKRVRSNLLNFPSRCEIRAEPYGLTLILGPWNYPFQLVTVPLIASIAAGNCAVLKPSEHAEATTALLAELFSEWFDEKYISVVSGGAEIAQQLLDHTFDYVFYTGNAKVGRQVMHACTKNLTPLTLELGGKSPCIVDKNINMEIAAKRIVRGKFFNAGQTCVAPDYLCIHQSIYKPFVDLLEKTIVEFFGADPEKSPDYGRIINQKHFDRLTHFLCERARSIGQHKRGNRFFAPTIIPDASWEDAAMEDEIFGPILPCITYSDITCLLKQIQSRPKPLALYVFSNDKMLQEECLQTVVSGGACINDTLMHITPLTLPFGGIGESGMGQYHGKSGFDTFSHQRSIMRKKLGFDSISVYPPYGTMLDKLKPFLSWLSKWG